MHNCLNSLPSHVMLQYQSHTSLSLSADLGRRLKILKGEINFLKIFPHIKYGEQYYDVHIPKRWSGWVLVIAQIVNFYHCLGDLVTLLLLVILTEETK